MIVWQIGTRRLQTHFTLQQRLLSLILRLKALTVSTLNPSRDWLQSPDVRLEKIPEPNFQKLAYIIHTQPNQPALSPCRHWNESQISKTAEHPQLPHTARFSNEHDTKCWETFSNHSLIGPSEEGYFEMAISPFSKLCTGQDGLWTVFPKDRALWTKSKARVIESLPKISSPDKILRGHMETFRLLLISNNQEQ